jgi:hypothetical protein
LLDQWHNSAPTCLNFVILFRPRLVARRATHSR